MAPYNPFRILGDCSHALSKFILLYAIYRNKSAEGVSLITQVLYAIVFCSRYTDIFRHNSVWNEVFKIFYITSSFYIIFLMRWVYPRTREKELGWKLGAGALVGSLALSPFTMLLFQQGHYSLFYWLRDFSLILESVCILPQLLLLRQTTVPTVIDSFYLVALGSYRALYILNWIVRGADIHDLSPDATSVIFGIIQTALYVDFFWVYYTRQRVKLRNGGVVDADDLRRGWLLNRIFGRFGMSSVPDHDDDDEHDAFGGDEESAPALGRGFHAANSRGKNPTRATWGKRGISVSADEGVLDQEHGVTDFSGDGEDADAKMQDPDELAKALDDGDDDGTLPSASNGHTGGTRSGEEWRD